jgi:RNA polymerase sigma factor (sigma-70 family)
MENGKENKDPTPIQLTDKEFTKRLTDSEHILHSYAKQLKSKSPEDLVQDTLLKMWKNKHMYRYEDSFNAWAKKIMKNIFISQAVKEDKMRYSRNEEDDWSIFDYISSLKSYNPAIPNITIEDIYESIERVLSPKDQYIVKQFLNGFSQEEIGDSINKKRNNIKQRYFWAIREVRDDLRNKFMIENTEYKQSESIIKKQIQYHKKKAQEEYMYRKLKFKDNDTI